MHILNLKDRKVTKCCRWREAIYHTALFFTFGAFFALIIFITAILS